MNCSLCNPRKMATHTELATQEEEDPTTVRRKECATAKGLITRLLTIIENIPKNKESVGKISEKN